MSESNRAQRMPAAKRVAMDIEFLVFILAMAFLLGAALVGVIVHAATTDAWRKEAIDRDAGGYSPTTGEWRWK